MCGCFSTCRKSSLRTWLSRAARGGVVGDRGGVDGGVHARLELGRAGDEGAFDLLELAADLADHHVPDAEADLGVDRVDGPGACDVTGNLSSSGAHGLSLTRSRVHAIVLVRA